MSGAVTFNDVDLSDLEASSITNTAVSPDAGQRLRPDHGAARRAGQCLLDRHGSHDTVSGDGSIAWTYSISDGALDFLGANDVVTLTYTVQADDHNGGTTSQNVTITVSGTEDAPTLTSGTQAATVTEIADDATGENTATHTVSGAVTFNDVDLSDLEAQLDHQHRGQPRRWPTATR